jgi:hypothetical protein
MSAVSEWIAREYFEQLGYLTSQPYKYISSSRQKKADEELDLLIVHPQVQEHRTPEHMVWTTDDLSSVARAVVGVRGWHTERIYAATLEQTPEISRFASQLVRSAASARLGSGPVAAVLCLPELPASGALKEKTLRALRERGIDGVLSFRTMLSELVSMVKTNRNYDKSDLLQILRILKNYEFLREPQMELFVGRGRKPRRKVHTVETE